MVKKGVLLYYYNLLRDDDLFKTGATVCELEYLLFTYPFWDIIHPEDI